MDDSDQARRHLRDLFSSQLFCVLATQEDGQPYANLVAFVATDDLRYLAFATSRNTRKYGNISADPRVALMVDNSSNQEVDVRDAVATTALGTAEEVKGADREHLLGLYLAKHPNLKEFVTSPECALLRVGIGRYYVVSHFQNVVELAVPR